MRLIDADKLHYKRVLLGEGYKSDIVVFAKEIDKAHKVEAIPIEWLKKKYEEADDMGMGIEDWSEKDCFGHVIKEWEKENGTNRQK